MSKRIGIRRFLLGALPPREQTEFENRFLADDNAFEELLSCENDLIDDYVHGRLSPGGREQFEKRYCDSPGHLARVSFAAALREHRLSSRHAAVGWPASRSLVWVVAASVAFAAGLTWLVIRYHRSPGQLQSAIVPRPSLPPRAQELHPKGATVAPPANRRTRSTVVQEESPRIEPSVAMLTLTPGLFRSPGTPQPALRLDPGQSFVQLKLATEGTYPGYEAELQTVEGRIVTRIAASDIRTRSGAGPVMLRLPAKLLPSGDYVLKLSGIGKDGNAETSEFYSFRVLR